MIKTLQKQLLLKDIFHQAIIDPPNKLDFNFIKGNYGMVEFMDCIEGMKKFSDKQFDLCFTGIPYPYEKKDITNHRKKDRKRIIYLYDLQRKVKEQLDWLMNIWFKEIKRVCNMVIFQCGYKFMKDWIIFEPSLDMIFWYNTCKSSGAKTGDHNNLEPFMCYNTEQLIQLNTRKNIDYSKAQCRLPRNLIEYPYGNKNLDYYHINHPCPFPKYIVDHFFTYIKPKSVLEPFGGSGTVFEICEKRGIPYHGFELPSVNNLQQNYKHDIQFRMRQGMLMRNIYQKTYQKKQLSIFDLY